MSLSEQFVKPTSMLYRNFLAMETEELLRQHPIDGAVLMGGCDKTTPATIMGAISMNLPVIFMPAGPMMRGHFGGNILGSGSDVWKYWAEKEAGNISERAVERYGGGHRAFRRHLHDHGHCLDHDDDRRGARAHAARGRLDPGRRCRASAHGLSLRPAHRRDGLGGSQAARHSSRANRSRTRWWCTARWRARPMPWCISSRWRGAPGVPIDLKDFDEFASRVPVIVNLRPSGKWLMEDFHIAGGTRALLLAAQVDAASRCAHGAGQTIGGRNWRCAGL